MKTENYYSSNEILKGNGVKEKVMTKGIGTKIMMYIVLVFAFLFVGVFSGSKTVEAGDSKVTGTANSSGILLIVKDTAWFGYVNNPTYSYCNTSCVTALSITSGDYDYVGVYLRKSDGTIWTYASDTSVSSFSTSSWTNKGVFDTVLSGNYSASSDIRLKIGTDEGTYYSDYGGTKYLPIKQLDFGTDSYERSWGSMSTACSSNASGDSFTLVLMANVTGQCNASSSYRFVYIDTNGYRLDNSSWVVKNYTESMSIRGSGSVVSWDSTAVYNYTELGITEALVDGGTIGVYNNSPSGGVKVYATGARVKNAGVTDNCAIYNDAGYVSVGGDVSGVCGIESYGSDTQVYIGSDAQISGSTGKGIHISGGTLEISDDYDSIVTTITGATYGVYATGSAKVTLTKGTIQSPVTALSLNGATLTMSGGTIQRTGTTGEVTHCAISIDSGSNTVTISGGVVKTEYTYADAISVSGTSATANISISGGTITGSSAVYTRSGSTLTITGGTFYTIYNWAIYSYGTATISGGTIYAGDKSNADAAVYNHNSLTISSNAIITATQRANGVRNSSGNVTISGGTITSVNSAAVSNEANSNYTMTISGGTISSTGAQGVGNYGNMIINGSPKITGAKGIWHWRGDSLNVSGTPTITGTAGPGLQAVAYEDDNANTVTISSGTISGSTYGIYNQYEGVNISGGTISGTTYGVFNETGTVCITGGSISGTTKGIYNTSTATRSMTLAGTAYTTTVGISSRSGVSVTVSSVQNNAAADMRIKGYSSTYKVTISGAVSNSNASAVMSIYANSTLSSTLSNSGTAYVYNGASVAGTTTNTGYLYTAGTLAAITNNSGGTINIEGGTIGAVTNNSTTTKSMTLVSTAYTTTIGIESTSSRSATVASISNTVAGKVHIVGYSTTYKVTVSGTASNSNASGYLYIYAYGTLSSTLSNSGYAYVYTNAKVSGTTTNTGYLYTAGTLAAITNNSGGTINIEGGTIGAVTNNSTTTKSMTLVSTAYTTTIGIESTSSRSATVASISNTVAGKVHIVGYSTTYKVTVSGTASNSNASGYLYIYAHGTLSSTLSNSGYAYAYANAIVSGTTTNSGTLTVSGGSLQAITNSGTVTVSGGSTGNVTNTGSLNVSGGTVGAITNNSGGTVYISRGTTGAITNNSTTTRSMSLAGTSYTTTVGISSNSSGSTTVASVSNTVAGKVHIKGYSSTYKATVSGAVSNSNASGSVTVYANGVISGTTTNAGTLNVSGGLLQAITNSGTVTVSGGSTGNVTNTGSLNVSGGSTGTISNTKTVTVSGGSTGTITNSGTGTVSVSGGTVSGSTYGINNSSSSTSAVVVTGGTVRSTGSSASTYGIYTSKGTVRIGTNSGTPSTSSPVIQSAGGFGLYEGASTAVTQVYDGIIKGKYNADLKTTTACKGYTSSGVVDVGCNEIVNAMPDGYGFTIEYDSTNGVASQYLVAAGARIERDDPDSVTETIAASLTKIDSYYNDSGTVVVLKLLTECVSITSNLNIILDLNGENIECSSSTAITNAGTLKINATGIISAVTTVIRNTGILTLEAATLQTTAASGDSYAISNAGTATINGGSMTSNTKVLTNTGTMYVNGGIVSGKMGILVTSGTVTMKSGTVTGSDRGAWVDGTDAKMIVNGGTLSGVNHGALTTGVLEVNGGLVVGTGSSSDGIYNSSAGSGTIKITGGEVRGVSRGVYNYSTATGTTLTITGGIVRGTGSSSYGILAGTQTAEIIGDDAIVTSPNVAIYTNNSSITKISAGKIGSVTLPGETVVNSQKGVSNNGNAIIQISGGSITAVAAGIYNTSSNEGVIISGGTIESTGTNAGNAGINTSNGTITISGNASVSGYEGAYVHSGAGITINGGSITATSWYGVSVRDGATLNMSSGTITGSGASGAGIYTNGSSNVSISGGTIQSNQQYGIFNTDSSSVTITGGNVTGTYGIWNTSSAIVNANGGTITGTSTHGVYNALEATLTVNGATISGKSAGVSLNNPTSLNVISGSISGATGIDNISTLENAVVVSGGTITGTSYGISSTAGTVSVSGGSISGTISNSAIVNISGGTVGTITNNSGGTVYISKGTIGAITNKSATTRSMSLGGTSYTATIGISSNSSGSTSVATVSNTAAGYVRIRGYSSTYKATVNGAVVNSNASGYIYVYNYSALSSTLTNKGYAYVYSNATVSGATTNEGTLTVSGGSVSTVSNTGTFNVSGGSTNTITNSSSGKVNVSGGTVSGSTYGINNSSSSTSAVVITGGTVKATGSSASTYGIYTSAGTVRIGTNSGTPSTSSPVIQSVGGFGLYESTSSVVTQVYDGIIKGKYNADLKTTTACKGYDASGKLDVGCNEIVNAMPDGYGFTVEYSGSVTSQYLVSAGARVNRPDPDLVEDTIQDAINKIDNYYSDVGTVVVLKNATECISIVSALNITLNLNGKTVTCNTEETPAITNNGTLTINDSVGNGVIKSTVYQGISTVGNLVINSGTIQGSASDNNARGIYSSGTANITINGGSVIGFGDTFTFGIWHESTGTLTINGGEIKGYNGTKNNFGINNYSTGKIVINNGTITGENNSSETGDNTYGFGVRNASTGIVTINDGTILGTSLLNESENNRGIYNSGNGTINILGGNISGMTGVYNAGVVNMSDGTISAISCGIQNTSTKPKSVTISGGVINVDKTTTGTDSSSSNYSVYGINNTSSGGIEITGGEINASHHIVNFAKNGDFDIYLESIGIRNALDAIVDIKAGKLTTSINIEGVTNSGTGTYGYRKIGIWNVESGTINVGVTGNVGPTIVSSASIPTSNPFNYLCKIGIYNPASGNVNVYSGNISATSTVLSNGSAGTIVVENGTLQTTTSVGDGYAIYNSGTATIKGGNMSGNSKAVINKGTMTVSGGTANGDMGLMIESGTVTMSDGTFIGAERGAYISGGKLTMTGGKLSGEKYGMLSVGTFKMSGGLVEGTGADGYGIYNSSAGSGTIEISGGEVRGVTKGIYNYSKANISLTMTGGVVRATGSTSYGIEAGAKTIEIKGANAIVTSPNIAIYTSGSSVTKINAGKVGSVALPSGTAVNSQVGISNNGNAIVQISGGQVKGNTAINDAATYKVSPEKGYISISSGNVIGTSVGVKTVASKLIVNGSTASISGSIGIDMSGTSILEFSAGSISSTNYGIKNTSTGTMSVSGGIITTAAISSTAHGIYHDSTTNTTISGVEVSSTSEQLYSSAVYNASTATMTISSGKYYSSSSSTTKVTTVIANIKGNLNIDGGEFSGYSNVGNVYGVQVDAGTFTMSSGTFTINTEVGIYYAAGIRNSGTTIVTGGVINVISSMANAFGIRNNSGASLTIENVDIVTSGSNQTYPAVPIFNLGSVIVNGGSFTTSGASSKVSGMYNGGTATATINGGTFDSTKNGIYNYGVLNVNGGTIDGDKYGIYTDAATSVVNIKEPAVIDSAEVGIYNIAELNVLGGEITGGTRGVHNAANGIVTISDGTIEVGEGEALYNESSELSGDNYTVKISGGSFVVLDMNSGYAIYNKAGIMNISNASANSLNDYGLYNEAGTVNVTSLSVYGDTALYNGGTLNVENISLNAAYIGINNTGTATINGGTLSSSSLGVSNSGTLNIVSATINASINAIESSGTLTIGSENGTPSSSNPLINGIGGFGILEKSNSAITQVYDGIIKGKYNTDLKTTTACKGYDASGNLDVGCNEIVNAMPDGYGFTVEYDSTNGVSSQYLVQAGARVSRSDPDPVLATIQNAINIIDTYYGDTGTITLLRNAVDTYAENVSIKAGLNITIELNGKSWSSATATITNAGTLTINGTGTIESTVNECAKTTIENTGTFVMNGGTIIDTDTCTYVIKNTGTATINGGTVGVSNRSDTGIGNFGSGVLTVNGGTIQGASLGIENNGSVTINNGTIESGYGSGIYTSAGTLNIKGGSVTAISGEGLHMMGGTIVVDAGTITGELSAIYIGLGSLTINGGEIASNGYALYANRGNVTYNGGTLKGSATNNYVYDMASGVTYSTGTKSEYTVIESGKYVTVLKNALQGSTDGTIKKEISEISTTGTIKLLDNMTEASIEIPAGKNITLDLGGKLLNSYITTRVATHKTSEPFITVKGELTIINGSMEMYNSMGDLIYVEKDGILNIGRSSDALSTTIPSLKVVNGLKAVLANPGATVNYNNGVIKHAIDKFEVQYKDLYIREGYYIEHTASEMKLVSDSSLGLEPIYYKAVAKEGEANVVLTITHENKSMTNSDDLDVYLRGQGTMTEMAMTCSSSGTVTTCAAPANQLAYVYNAVYEDEMLFVYRKTTSAYRLKLVRADLEIIPDLKDEEDGGGQVKDPITNEANDGSGRTYDILSDGEIFFIDITRVNDLYGNNIAGIDVNHDSIKDSMFGPNWNKVFESVTLTLEEVKDENEVEGMSNTGNGYVNIRYAIIKYTAEIREGYVIPESYVLEDQARVLIYDYSPKLSVESAGAASLVTCEYGSDCAISPLSFYDYLGNELSNVETVITKDGEVVESIDTSELGTYVVTSRAKDMFGARSLPVVQEYVVKDNVAPVLKVSNEAIVVNKGSQIEDIDEIEVSDNYDKVLMVERINSEIDVNKAGTYKLGYRVVDSNGNETIVYRDVIVKEVSNSNVWIWYVIGITLLLGVIGIASFMYIRKRK